MKDKEQKVPSAVVQIKSVETCDEACETCTQECSEEKLQALQQALQYSQFQVIQKSILLVAVTGKLQCMIGTIQIILLIGLMIHMFFFMCKMRYTRTQLANHYNVTKGKLRRILKALQLQPVQVERTATGRPVFYYADSTVLQIDKYLDALMQKKQQQLVKCCICKQSVSKSSMIGGRCQMCYVKKCCAPIMYGKQFWNRKVNAQTVSTAIRYLQSMLPGST